MKRLENKHKDTSMDSKEIRQKFLDYNNSPWQSEKFIDTVKDIQEFVAAKKIGILEDIAVTE